MCIYAIRLRPLRALVSHLHRARRRKDTRHSDFYLLLLVFEMFTFHILQRIILYYNL